MFRIIKSYDTFIFVMLWFVGKLVTVFKILFRDVTDWSIVSARQTSLAVWLLLHIPRQIMVAAKGIDLPTAVLDVAPQSTTAKID
jgi:hypothetical protein